MDWQADWIWLGEIERPVNTHVCFRKTFTLGAEAVGKARLRISADSYYRVWINGKEAGEGPVRSTPRHWYYDDYDVSGYVRTGDNVIAVDVWHYGHSNYQYIENRAGLIARLDLGEDSQAGSLATDISWKAKRHDGFESETVKRNVNIGWLELFDARKWNDAWLTNAYDDSDWSSAVRVAEGGGGVWGELHTASIEPMAKSRIYPSQLTSISEVRPLRQVVSVNMRDNFYPGNRDANAKIFSGYLATLLETEERVIGKLTFAHSPWNGVQGRYKINSRWYKQGEEIVLEPGRHLFLLEICGVHNDLFSHMEWDFPSPIRFVSPFEPQGDGRRAEGADEGDGGSPFVTWGPFETIEPVADGYHPVYGGVEKETGLNRSHPAFAALGEAAAPADLLAYRSSCKAVEPSRIILNHMIYSLMLRKQTVATRAVQRKDERMLYGHPRPSELAPPADGADLELIVDFGKLYVGQIEFDLDAEEGTVIDIYGFETMVDGKVRYTGGLNNAFRYTARGGRQSYRSVTRMGFRYLIVAIRGQTAPVSFYSISVLQSGYPVTDQAVFRCSDPLLNDIWEISRHTSEVCTEDMFVDCPTYERVFWVGDCRVSSLVNYYLFGSYELAEHCLTMVPRSREQSGLLLSCMPTDWQSVIPMWTFSWVIACKEYVEYSGDTKFIGTIYPDIAETLETYYTFINDKGLFDISSWNLLDWAELDIPYVGVGTAQHAALAYCCRITADMARRLSQPEDERRWNERSERLKASMNVHLWDDGRNAYIDGWYRSGKRSGTCSVQTHTLLYLFDMLDHERKAAVESRLIDPPADWVRIGTPFMSFYLFEAWQRMGRLDRIVSAIRQDWGTMVRHGSTTCWETFAVYPRSFAHAWSAAPAYVLGKYGLGVAPVAEGFRRISVCPPELDGLEWAEGSVPTPHGRIDVEWSRENGSATLRLRVPQGIGIDDAEARERGWDIRIERVGDTGEGSGYECMTTT